MAKTSMIVRDIKRAKRVNDARAAGVAPRFKCRTRNRCQICGRPRGYIRFFKMCRICVREHAAKGLIPGLRKSSW